MGESLREYSIRTGKEYLLEQWHPYKNGNMVPEQVSYGSHTLIWWKCSKSHEWTSPVYVRAGKNTGCPYCAGKKTAPGQDLQSKYPNIAAQWHPTKNNDLKPTQFSAGSRKLVWWQCPSGHSWSAMIKTRVGGSGCPVCANKIVIPGENDLQTCNPILAKQWHPTKNGAFLPNQVSCGSTRKVWWRCEYGHEWRAAVYSRDMGTGCPVCMGKLVIPGENDLNTLYPEIAHQWIPEKNGKLSPSHVSENSNKRVWWRCTLGHEWQCTVASRTSRRTGCPFCTGRKVLPGFNDLKTVQPLVAAQWNHKRNAPLEPSMVTAGSSKKVWWQCNDGHEWKAIIFSRTGAKKCGCPICARGKSKRR